MADPRDQTAVLQRSYPAGSEGAAVRDLWRDEESLRPLGYVFRESRWVRDGYWDGVFADGLIRGFGRATLALANMYVPSHGTLFATFARIEAPAPDAAGDGVAGERA